MKGVILAGGSGSRLFPLTKVTNKHLLPVGRVPMLFHPIYKLREAGITKILIVAGKEHIGSIITLLGSGVEFGVHFTYCVQDEAGGIAQALALAENFSSGSPMVVILGDNIFKGSIKDAVSNFVETQKTGAKILLKEVEDPQRYGVAELDDESVKVIDIVEKPKNPKTSWAVTGVYMYDARVFDIIKTLKPSGRGELEITDVNNEYIRCEEMTWSELPGEWTDAGTFSSLPVACELMRDVEYSW